MSMKYVFDYRDGETYWCTADVGWVTGHTYIVYGPLAIGARTLMFEGVPTYPAGDRFWQVIAKHEVNLFSPRPPRSALCMVSATSWSRGTTAARYELLARSANPLTLKPGSGTTGWSATAAAPSSIPGGRQRPAGS